MAAIIGSVVRHVLTLLAGGLIVYGVDEKDSANLVRAIEPVLTGVAVYGASQAWSLVDSKKKKR
jgi:hypothetical protein